MPLFVSILIRKKDITVIMSKNLAEENEKYPFFVSITQDTTLLFFLVFATWGLNKFISWINLDTIIDKIVVIVLVWTFGILTILFTVSFFVKYVLKIAVKTWLDIKKELAKLNN